MSVPSFAPPWGRRVSYQRRKSITTHGSAMCRGQGVQVVAVPLKEGSTTVPLPWYSSSMLSPHPQCLRQALTPAALFLPGASCAFERRTVASPGAGPVGSSQVASSLTRGLTRKRQSYPGSTSWCFVWGFHLLGGHLVEGVQVAWLVPLVERDDVVCLGERDSAALAPRRRRHRGGAVGTHNALEIVLHMLPRLPNGVHQEIPAFGWSSGHGFSLPCLPLV